MGISSRKKRGCAPKTSDKTYKENTNRESCSLLESASAAGDYTNPTILWKAKEHRCVWYRDSELEETELKDWMFGVSDKGYNSKGITLEWLMLVFGPETRWTLDNPEQDWHS